MINNFEDALFFINNTGSQGIIPGLERIKILLDHLANPQDELKIIHVAGTNGKGSVCTFIASGLREAGFSVGRYISPTIIDYKERIQIDGVLISEEDFIKLTRQIYHAVEIMKADGIDPPSTFEAETALAFLYFQLKKCDYVILEVGMGGSLDATNVIEHPVLTVITRIAMDHMSFLGDTIEEIAENKAGIIKKSAPVVFFDHDRSVTDVILSKARMIGIKAIPVSTASISLESISSTDGIGFNFESQQYTTRLKGLYQIENASIAIKSLKTMEIGINEDQIKRGIAKADWPGRFEKVNDTPPVFVDGAHNPDGVIALKKCVDSYFNECTIIYVCGIFADKNHDEMLHIIENSKSIFITFKPDHPRGLKGELLANEASKYQFNQIYSFEKQRDALDLAFKLWDENSVIVQFGSLSTISGLLNYLGSRY